MKDLNYLKDEVTRLENIIKATNIGTWEWEVQTGKVVFNEVWANIIGYTLEELAPISINTWIDNCHPKDLEKVNDKLDRVFERKLDMYEVEVRMKHKNGSWIWILDKGEVVSWSEEGKPLLMVGSHINITKTKEISLQLNEALTKSTISEKMFKELYEKAPVGYQSLDNEGNFILVNEAYSTLLGYKVNDMLGRYFGDFMTESSAARLPEQFSDFLADGKVDVVFQMIHKDKHMIDVRFIGRISLDAAGEFKQTHCIVFDVTDLLKYQETLKVNQEKLMMILNSTSEGIYGVNDKEECTFVNNAFLNMIGYSENEVLGKKMHDLIHHSYEDGTPYLVEDCDMMNAYYTGIEYRNEDVIWKKDGTFIYVEYRANPQIKDNKIVGAVFTLYDISERRMTQNILRYEHEKAQKYLDVMGVLLLVLDVNGVVTLINKKGCEILGLNEEEIIGKNWFDNFIPKDGIAEIKSIFDRVFENEMDLAEHSINSIITSERGERTISWYNSVLYDINNKIIGVLSSGEDITEKLLAEERLLHSRDLMRYILEHNKSAVAVHDKDLKYLYVSQSYIKQYNVKEENIIGKHHYDVFPDLPQKWRDVHKKSLLGQIFSSEKDLYEKEDGSKEWTRWECRPWYESDNSIGGIIIYTEVITKEVEILDSLKSSLKQNSALINAIPDIIFILDTDGVILDYRAPENTVLYEESEVFIGKNMKNVVPINVGRKFESQFNKLKESEEVSSIKYSLDIENETRFYEARMIRSGNNQIISIIRDVTEMRRNETELEYLAYHDYLTGLYNRRYYEEKLVELDIAENYPITIVMADINGLKLINDAFGHISGDEVLISAANLLAKNCRETDLLSRIGGDEFVIVMPNTTEKLAGRIVENIKKDSKQIITESIELSISFGYNSKTHESENIQDIYRSAEDLMYREKLLEIPSMRSGAIETILSTLNEKDKNSELHSRTVSRLSERIAKAYGMNAQDIAEVKTAGLLHDIGKIIIPISIINKEGKLTLEEYTIMKNHPEIGFRILNSTSNMRGISDIVLNHHERCDGKGYPRGIMGKDIPIKSKIISIADAFDAMTSERSYKDIISKEEALKEILDNTGTQFNREVVKVFKEHFEEITSK